MDSIQAEVSLLSDQLFSLPHNSPEVRVSYDTCTLHNQLY